MQPPTFSLAGKLAVITGASRGIGAALAAALAAAGARVVLWGRDRSALAAVQARLADAGGQAAHAVVDVTDAAAVGAAFVELARHERGVDILVNNAGVEQLCPSRDVGAALWDRIMDTNLRAAFFCAQAAARHMRPGASILNVCSLTSEVGVPGAAAYGASKAGLAGLTRTLAAEWAADGIRVNGIGPGYFRTALTESFYRDPAWQERMLEKIPLRRFGRPEDLGGAAVFLCSDAAGYVTGQILYVDGGYLACI